MQNCEVPCKCCVQRRLCMSLCDCKGACSCPSSTTSYLTHEHAVRYLALSSIWSNYFKQPDTLNVARRKTRQNKRCTNYECLFTIIFYVNLIIHSKSKQNVFLPIHMLRICPRDKKCQLWHQNNHYSYNIIENSKIFYCFGGHFEKTQIFHI